MEEEEKKHSKKKIILIVLIVIGLMIGAVYVLFVRPYIQHYDYWNKAQFGESEGTFFTFFSRIHSDPNEYKIKSLDAYFLSATEDLSKGTYYWHVVYDMYLEGEWKEVDAVLYGSRDKIENLYCLSGDTPIESGFKEENEEYERAVTEGIHKSYDISKFRDYIDKYKDKE